MNLRHIQTDQSGTSLSININNSPGPSPMKMGIVSDTKITVGEHYPLNGTVNLLIKNQALTLCDIKIENITFSAAAIGGNR